MKPEQWHRAEELYHEALEKSSAQRDDFLARASAGDEVLHRKVQALLKAHEEADFLVRPTLEIQNNETIEEPTESLVGQQISHYKIVSEIGKGGMGHVYLAEDTRLDRQVALKILPATAARNEDRRRRFVVEAKAASAFNHPNVVAIYDVGQGSGLHFIVMEYVEGQTLAERIRIGSLETAEIVNFGIQICDALEAAHVKGITHRDIKPTNLILTSRGQIKVMDFGIAKIMQPRPSESDTSPDTSAGTSPGVVLGTLHHMSPEQVLGGDVDHRTDIFSLGVSLFQMATGCLPFAGATMTQTMDQILHREPDSIPSIPAELDRIIHKCLEKEPGQRYQTARELQVDLKNVHLTRRRVLLKFAAVLSLVILGAVSAGVAYWGRTPAARPTIAVFGFKNSADDVSKAWLSTALSEWFRTELSLGGNFRIISAEDVERARTELALPIVDTMGKSSLALVQKNLGADYVLLGSYLQLGEGPDGQIRLDAKLQRTINGDVVASIARSGTIPTLFQLVSDAGAVLSAKLGIDQSQAASDREQGLLPRDPEATRLYSEGVARLRVYDAVNAARFLEDAARVEPDSALIHSALAETWLSLGYQKKAIEEAMKALAVPAELPRETALGIQARYHEILGEWDQAIAIYQSLWTVFRDNPEHGLRLASAQSSGNQGSMAITTLAELRQMSPKMATDPRVDLAEAIAAEALGESERELTASMRAIERAESTGARLLAARARLRASWALGDLSRWDEAFSLATHARQTFAEVGDRVSEASAIKLMADTLDDRGDHDQAKQVYEQAVALFRTIGHQRGTAVALNNLGEALRSLGELDAAKQSYEEALQFANSAGDAKLQSIILNGIGSMRWRRGDLAGAQDAYERAVEGLRSAGLKNVLANSILNLAVVLQDQGYLDESLKSLEEVLAIATELHDQGTAARAHGNMGELLMRKGDLLSAKKHFVDQLALGGKIPDEKQSALALVGLAQIQAAQGEIGDAKAKFKEAVRLHAKNKEEGLIAEARLALAQAELEDNKFSAAADEARQASIRFHDDKQIDQESLAAAVLAYSLAAAGQRSASVVPAARAAELFPDVQHVARRLSTAILMAQLKAAQGNVTQARRDLRSTLNQAQKILSLPHQLQIRRVLCEIDSQDCTPELEKEARDRGFLQVANTVSRLRYSRYAMGIRDK